MEEHYELAKWLAGEMSEKELETFQKTKEYDSYLKIATYSAQMEAPNFNQERLYDNIVATKKSNCSAILLHKRNLLKIAALLFLFLGIIFFYKSYISLCEKAGKSEKTVFELPDNSNVALNACSEIKYSKWSWEKHRQLNLQGEAYFKVAKGKVFEVHTDLGTVTVLGTQFNVKSRDGRLDVSCYEGCVKVNYKNKEVYISKGKSVAFTHGNAIKIPNHTTTQPTWIKEELSFNQEHLEPIINELNRQYTTTIELRGLVPTQLFTGTIPMKNLDEALQILTSTFHLKTTKIKKNTIVLEADDAR